MGKKHYHLIGIGGTGMSGLARMLKARGNVVTGSDVAETETTIALVAEDIHVSCPQAGKNLPKKCDMVISSAAVPKANPEMRAARRRKIRIRKYAEMLGELMDGRTGVAFAGTHGKTTSAALAAHILATSGSDPSFLIGGELAGYNTNARAGSGEHFVVEACEFGRSFLNISPHIAVVTNIEADHLDYYRNLNEIIGAFHEFVSAVPETGLVVINADDENAAWAVKDIKAEVQTVGFDSKADWSCRILPSAPGRTRFMTQFRGKVPGVADLGLVGEHNVQNALGVTAALHHAGIRGAEILNGMATFRGVRRRFEIISGKLPVTVIDDYAHHPTEIKSVIKSARIAFPGKQVWALFQPHQYSRTRFFLEEFADVLTAADFVVIPNIFAARDSGRERKSVSAKDLVEAIINRGGDAEFTNGFDAALELLEEELTPEIVLVTMGAGDINLLAYEFCRRQAG